MQNKNKNKIFFFSFSSRLSPPKNSTPERQKNKKQASEKNLKKKKERKKDGLNKEKKMQFSLSFSRQVYQESRERGRTNRKINRILW